MTTHHTQRTDAVYIGHGHERREYVPTTGATKWVASWAEFQAAGGVMNFNEDQTEITLTLPEGNKFGIGFGRADKAAPDMLAALRSLVAALRPMHDAGLLGDALTAAYRSALAAIAKAEGRS